jgi:hypothetical protein
VVTSSRRSRSDISRADFRPNPVAADVDADDEGDRAPTYSEPIVRRQNWRQSSSLVDEDLSSSPKIDGGMSNRIGWPLTRPSTGDGVGGFAALGVASAGEPAFNLGKG